MFLGDVILIRLYLSLVLETLGYIWIFKNMNVIFRVFFLFLEMRVKVIFRDYS